jgi:hypothetical protein
MTASTTTSEFARCNGDYFHSGLAKQGIRIGVPVVANHDTGRNADHVVAVVPLFPLSRESVAAGLDDTQLLESEGFSDDVQEGLFFSMNLD